MLAVAALFHYLNFSIASYVSLLVIFLVTLSLGAYSLRWGIWLDTALPALCLLVVKWFVNLKSVWQSWRKPGVGPRALLSTRYQVAAGAAPNDGASEGASAGQDGPRTSEVSRSVAGVVAAFVLSALGAWPAGAEAPVTAGHVAGLGGATSDYEIRRDASGREQRVRVWYYMPVLSGDRIIVERDDGWIDLDLGEARTIRVRSENSPYQVPDVGDPPTPLGNLIAKVVATVGGMLSWSKNQEEAAQAIGLTSRSGEAGRLRLPLLGDGPGRIAAGERQLSLTWRGGTPPYAVRLYGREGRSRCCTKPA